MLRRTFFKRILAAAAGTGAVLSGVSSAAAATPKQRVAYHLADEEKVDFVLGNMRNHVKGVGGPENVELVLVVHGPALKAFHAANASEKTLKSLADLEASGIRLNACGNTMRAQKVELGDLLPGFARFDQGGVVRLCELQQQGYLYLRP